MDGFKVVAHDANMWIDRIASALLVKYHGPRNNYLGCDYKYHYGEDIFPYGGTTYTNEANNSVEQIYDTLSKESTSLLTKYNQAKIMN